MDMVKSKVFGLGNVVNKEVKEKGTYITVEFESCRQVDFGVPGSLSVVQKKSSVANLIKPS